MNDTSAQSAAAVTPEEGAAAEEKFGKARIVNRLGDAWGYRSYLELATATTGWHFADVSTARFQYKHRLLYRCPDGYEDGMEVTFRALGDDIAACAAEMRAERLSYDVVLVDPHHEYATSYRDLEFALDRLNRNGAIVVHDCRPPNAALAVPQFHRGSWCGVTYAAYLDFLCAHPELDYFTIDADYGCGVIRRARRKSRDFRAHLEIARAGTTLSPKEALELARLQNQVALNLWRAVERNDDERFAFFDTHARALLNLVSVDRFMAMRLL